MRKYLDILKEVEKAGVQAWVVGDTARRIVMGVAPMRVTMAVDPCDLNIVAKTLSCGAIDSRGTYPVLRGEYQGMPFRIYCLQGSSIEEDLARRDFTINAVAFRSDGGVVDPFGGRHDIRNRLVRLTGDDTTLLEKDPIRIIRMLRFASELRMDIFWKSESDVRRFIEHHRDVIHATPVERWGKEIMSGLKVAPWRFVSLCDFFLLNGIFLKELDSAKSQKFEGETETLFDHIMRTLRVIENRFETQKILRSDIIPLAGLFSRLETRTLLDEDVSRPLALVSSYLKGWNVSGETIEAVQAIIRGYRLFYCPTTEEELCSLVLENGLEPVQMMLEFAVCVAKAEDLNVQDLRNNRWKLEQVERRFHSVEMQTEGSRRFLTGKDVMELLNLKPGRKVGEVLKSLDMAVGTGEVARLSDAKAWVMRYAGSL